MQAKYIPKLIRVAASVILGMAFLVFPTSCNKGPSQDKPSRLTLKVGAILPMTGSVAFLGEAQAAALRVAKSHLERSFGLKVELLIEDTKGDTKAAVDAAHKLISIDHVDLAFVTTSASSQAVAPVFAESPIPLITICSDESIARTHKQSVNFYVGIDDEIKAILARLSSSGIDRISALRVNASITKEAVKLLTEQKDVPVTLVTDAVYDLKSVDVRDDAIKLSTDSSSGLLIIAYGSEIPVLLRQLKESGFTKPIFGNYSFTSTGARSAGTESLQNVTFTSFPISPQELSSTSFGKDYSELTGHPPSPFLDYVFAYEALQIAGRFMNTHGSLSGFIDSLRGASFDTQLGKILIDVDGNATVKMTTAHYDQHGNIVLDK